MFRFIKQQFLITTKPQAALQDEQVGFIVIESHFVFKTHTNQSGTIGSGKWDEVHRHLHTPIHSKISYLLC